MNSDEILEQELLKRELITKEKLAECKQELSEKENVSLSALLLEKKIVTEEQLRFDEVSLKDDYEQALADIEKVLALQSLENNATDTVSSSANIEIEEKKPLPLKKTTSFNKLPPSKTLEPVVDKKENTSSNIKKTTSFEMFSSSKPLDFGDEISGKEKLAPAKKTESTDNLSAMKLLALGDIQSEAMNPSSLKKTTSFNKLISKEDAGTIYVPPPAVPESSTSDALLNLPEIPKEESVDIPFGKACVLLRFATEEQIEKALEEQSKNPGKPLGEILVEQKVLTPEKVKTVLSRQKSQTLICYPCNKKYQIVLYQPGRSYKCKVCNKELEKFSETKARKRKEKIDLMGLTQSFAVKEESSKIDTKGIDFAAGSQPDAQNVLSTSDILKKAGVIPGMGQRRTITLNRKKNYTSIAIGTLLLGLTCWLLYYFLFVFTVEIPTKIEKKPIHYTPDTKQYFTEEKKQDAIEKMNQEYQSLSQVKYNEDNIDALRIGIESWQAFLTTYPQTTKRDEIVAQIYVLQDIMKKAIERRDFQSFERKFGEKMSIGDMNGAEKILSEYQAMSNDSFYQRQYQEKEKNLQAIAKENMEKEIATAMSLVQEKRFQDALLLIERNKKSQIASLVPSLEEKILQIKQAEEEFLWGNTAFKVAYSLYPLLLEKKYTQAIELIEKQSPVYPQYQKQFEQWKFYIQQSEILWKNCQNVFLQNKDKEITIQITDQAEMKVTPKSFSPKTETLVFLWDKKFKNIKLGHLSSDTFRKLLLNKGASQEQIAQLALFTALFKEPKSIREDFPEILKHPFLSQLFLIYTLSSVFSMLEQKNFTSLEEIFKDLKKNAESQPLYENKKIEIAKKIWECAMEIEKTGKKKASREALLRMILEYFGNTPFAPQAKDALK